MNFLEPPSIGWLQVIFLLSVLCIVAKPMGLYLAKVFSGKQTILFPFLGWIERLVYALCGIDQHETMTASVYLRSVLSFSVVCFAGFFTILQAQDFPFISLDLALNITASFLTNTNWQPYVPESTLSSTTQMIGIVVQDFIAPTVGLSVLVAFSRAFSPEHHGHVGNFWTDLTRGILYIFLPFSLIFSILLVSQGVIQSFDPALTVKTLEDGRDQVLTLGPVATQVAIKQLGTNGGGFFAANAAHPFENPTPLSNFLQMIAMLLIPAGMPLAYGKLTGNMRHGWMLFITMFVLFVPFVFATSATEQSVAPLFNEQDIDGTIGNLVGKEMRFGAIGSSLFAVSATATAGGTMNASLESFFPLSSLLPLILIQLGEVVFGGVGSGLYGMLVFVFLTVFIAGLMIGRTPEYFGKKIGVQEMKMISLILLIPVFSTLVGTSLAVLTEAGTSGITNPNAQGFTEILYAFASASNNNGSSFSGLNFQTPFYNILLALCMVVGRFGPIIALLSVAGSMSCKIPSSYSAGTLRTETALFSFMLIGVIILTGLLTYVPALALGPVAEHYALLAPTEAP